MTDDRGRLTEHRESAVVEAFVHLSDTLVAGYDVIEFLHYLIDRCIELIDIDEAGVMLATPSGNLQAVAASTEKIRLLELFEIQNADGPCLDAFRTGASVVAGDLSRHVERWPGFAEQALSSGFRSAYSIPMRLRDTTIGAINLLRAKTGDLSQTDATLARALADIATVGVLQQRAIAESTGAAKALQHALTSRITIEQAKGILAERSNLSIDEAFELLRGHARRNNAGLTGVAEQVVAGTLDISERPLG
jgi:transcriptional regulator with GAF, ATPase, and Fis domain